MKCIQHYIITESEAIGLSREALANSNGVHLENVKVEIERGEPKYTMAEVINMVDIIIWLILLSRKNLPIGPQIE